MTDLTPLQPTRDPRVTLPDLVEVLLNKGVYLNLDLIITVADIPLIGLNLRATLAGIETMLEYGMMQQWDERTRASVQRSVARHVPLLAGEQLVARMAGGVYDDGFHHSWRPGTVYVTDQRLLVFRREPAEVLFEAAWETVRAGELCRERSVGGEDRQRLQVHLVDGTCRVLSAHDPARLLALVMPRIRAGGGALELGHADTPYGHLREAAARYQETRVDSVSWRAGTARIDTHTGLTWRAPSDARAAVTVAPEDIVAVEVLPEGGAGGSNPVLAVTAAGDATVLLALDDAPDWADLIRDLMDEPDGDHDRTEVNSGADR